MLKKIYLSLKKKFVDSDYKELNVLFIIGMICLIQISMTIFLNLSDDDSISIVIRSQLISIFGYVFGLKIKVVNEYYAKDVQFVIAAIISIICLIVLIIAFWLGITAKPIRSISIVRDLLASGVCFIIGLANNSNRRK